jgi:hypothetical protein
MSKNQRQEEPARSASADGKTKQPQAQFVIDFRHGPIIAKVWLCDGIEGTKFLKYSLPRYYRAESGDWIDRTDYFGRNEVDLIGAIKQACRFVNKHQKNPDLAISAANQILAEREANSYVRKEDELSRYLAQNVIASRDAASMQ